MKGSVEKDGIVRVASTIQLGSYFNCLCVPLAWGQRSENGREKVDSRINMVGEWIPESGAL